MGAINWRWAGKSFGKALLTFPFLLLACVLIFPNLTGNLTIFKNHMKSGSQLRYTSMIYHARMQTNGNLDVTEKLTVDLPNREGAWRQLYTRFLLDSRQATGIKNISVTNETSQQTYTQTSYQKANTHEIPIDEWNSQAANTWYLTKVDDDGYIQETSSNPADLKLKPTQPGESHQTQRVELGWNIPVTYKGTYTFSIHMTFENAITQYRDASQFQWSLIDKSNTVPIDHVKGHFYFPKGTKKSWAWYHFTGESTKKRGAHNSLIFTADAVAPGQYLDILSMFTHDSMKCARKSTAAIVDKTQKTEADSEARYNKQVQQKARRTVWVFFGSTAASIIMACLAWSMALKAYKKYRYQPSGDYRREPPDFSPSLAVRVYEDMAANLGERVHGKTKSKQISSLMLSLISKKAIAVYPGKSSYYTSFNLDNPTDQEIGSAMVSMQNDRHQHSYASAMTVHILPALIHTDSQEYQDLHLNSTEAALGKVLLRVSEEKGSPTFDSTDMSSILKKTKNANLLKTFNSSLAGEYKQAYIKSASYPLGATLTAYLMVLLGLWEFFQASQLFSPFAYYLVLGLATIISGLAARKYGKIHPVTAKGKDYFYQVESLRNYLRDFSQFNDRGVQDLVLWDRYLVYAAAFGMTKEVLQQFHQQISVMNAMGQAQSGVDGQASLGMAAGMDYSMSATRWFWMPDILVSHKSSWGSGMGESSGLGGQGFANDMPSSAFNNFGDFASDFSSSFSSIGDTVGSAISQAYGSSDSGYSDSGYFGGGGFSGGGGFGGGGGGGGGGSFGGR